MSYNDKFYDKEHSNESPEAIKADIERTRQDMGNKIDRIQNRLSPENLKVQAQDAVRTFVDENTESVKSYLSEHSKEIGAGMARAIKRNPIPAALVGLGVGWLLVESLGSDSEEQRRPTYYRGEPAYRGDYGNTQEWQRTSGAPSDYPYGHESTPYASQSVSASFAEQYRYNSPDADYTYQGQNTEHSWRHDQGSDAQDQARGLAQQASQQWHEASDKAQEWGSQVRTQAQDYASQARQQAGELGEQAQQYASQARQQVNQFGEQVQQQAAYVGEQAGYYAQRAGEQAQRSLEENPLIFGGVALAIGALVGLALPQTRRENEMMGQWRDEVIHSAQDVAQDALHRAEQVIEEVRPELEQTAKKVADDLKTSGAQAFADLKETGRQALNDVKQTGQEAVAETKQTMQKAEDRAKTEAEKSAEVAKDKAQNLTGAKA